MGEDEAQPENPVPTRIQGQNCVQARGIRIPPGHCSLDSADNVSLLIFLNLVESLN